MNAALLPADDSGYGFDNIGDVLTVSPLLTLQPFAVRDCCRLDEAACELMVMVEFLFDGDLLVFVLLAPHALFSSRLGAGLRERTSTRREP